jgi:hypothetical protein
MSFLRLPVSPRRVFHCLPGMLVPRLMILFIVMRGSDTMGVCGKIVEFRSSLV